MQEKGRKLNGKGELKKEMKDLKESYFVAGPRLDAEIALSALTRKINIPTLPFFCACLPLFLTLIIIPS